MVAGRASRLHLAKPTNRNHMVRRLIPFCPKQTSEELDHSLETFPLNSDPANESISAVKVEDYLLSGPNGKQRKHFTSRSR
jgi:hypothetical protein